MGETEQAIYYRVDLERVVEAVDLGPTSPLREPRWETKFVRSSPVEVEGWLVRLTFTRPDRDTGVDGRGSSRWEFIAVGTSESGAVKTLWLLCELTVRHELMEAFRYRGVRIFDPHHTVDELSMPTRAREATDDG